MTRLTLADCFDPEGERFGIPTYPWRYAPEGLATRRQLRSQGLRPGGQDVAPTRAADRLPLPGRSGASCAADDAG
jgi:hypothetical protein